MRCWFAKVTVALLACAAVAVPPPANATTGFRFRGVRDATQVITVVAKGYGDTSAQLDVWRKDSHGWHHVMGPWFSWVGFNGFAPPGQKREGDDRTPTGSFRLKFMFGV